MKYTRWHTLALAVVLAAAAAVYFHAINPNKLGFYHDDGLYVVAGKALATGQGYRIISLPDRPWETKYPPLFPFALSILWRANPDFPSNLPLLASLSLMSMLVFLGVGAAYLVRQGYTTGTEALVVLLLAAFNWRSAVLATSILSEALYAALAVCALWLAASLRGKWISLSGVALEAAMTLAVLTRVSGVALPAAILLHAFFKRRIGPILFPILMTCAAFAGWFWWCHLHQAAGTPSYGILYTDYFEDWQRMLGGVHQTIGSMIGVFAAMVGKNLLALLVNIPVVCLGVGMDWYKDLGDTLIFLAVLLGLFVLMLMIAGFWKTRSYGDGLLHCYIITYLALHIVWPYGLYDRFLIPLLPFLLFFLVFEGGHLTKQMKNAFRARASFHQAAFIIFLCLALISLLAILVHRSTYGLRDHLLSARNVYAAIVRQDRDIISWLKSNSDSGDVLACYRDPIYYLYADRSAIRLPAPSGTDRDGTEDERFLKFVDENNVKYLVRTENDFDLERDPAGCRYRFEELLKRHSVEFVPVFSTPDDKSTVYQTRMQSHGNGR